MDKLLIILQISKNKGYKDRNKRGELLESTENQQSKQPTKLQNTQMGPILGNTELQRFNNNKKLSTN